MPGPNMTCLQAMYKDITRLLGDSETSDMIVKCGDEELKVHSFVMMARSPVFHRMLTTDMVEKKDKMVTVKDWQVEVVREMVNFMYTATISPNFCLRSASFAPFGDGGAAIGSSTALSL